MAKGRKTGGRRAGTPNKDTADMRRIWTEAFHRVKYSPDTKAGVESLIRWGSDYPTEFYKLAARLIPQQQKLEHDGDVTVSLRYVESDE